MKKSFYKGLLVLVLAAVTSSFSVFHSRHYNDQLWFDPYSEYSFQFFGTTVEALDNFSGSLAGSSLLSVGYLYDRVYYPPVGNPFDTIVYTGGQPTYNSRLKMDEYGYPIHFQDTMIFE